MNQILAIPFEIRLAGLFFVGLFGGSVANLAVYRLAWYARSISPWSEPPAEAPARRAGDRTPVLGWLGLRREAALHGRGFWIRPMLVELLCGVGLAWLYWWEVGRMALLPQAVPANLAPLVMPALHAQFACHAVLVWLMLIASLIDADERIIPDSITVPGTLLGLLAASVYPRVLLPDWVFVQASRVEVLFLHVASPNTWPSALDGFPQLGPLALGLGCWWLWCVALMPRTWYSRHGWSRAVQLCFARLKREPATWWLLGLGLLGSFGVAAVWFRDGSSWMGLFSALVGMAASGGVVWLVRIIGTAVLGREAMGFGDVTLMAMMGTVLGWQTCLMVFFLAPFAGLVVGLAGLVLRRGPEIPYGPFLCLAAVVAIVRWQDLWQWAAGVFQLGWIVPAALVVCLILMAGLLAIWRGVLAVIG